MEFCAIRLREAVYDKPDIIHSDLDLGGVIHLLLLREAFKVLEVQFLAQRITLERRLIDRMHDVGRFVRSPHLEYRIDAHLEVRSLLPS